MKPPIIGTKEYTFHIHSNEITLPLKWSYQEHPDDMHRDIVDISIPKEELKKLHPTIIKELEWHLEHLLDSVPIWCHELQESWIE